MDLTVITTCVEYDDILSLTLEQNLKHFKKWIIITSTEDLRTQELVNSYESTLELRVTEDFYYKYARFNKGLAIENTLEYCGKQGWYLILDADILLPSAINWTQFQVGNLYTPQRYNVDLQTTEKELSNDTEFSGYFQLFHSSDPVLSNIDPWYGTHYPHAGFCDRDFQNMWPDENKIRPDFQVEHLGERDVNWFGRTTDRLDGTEIKDRETRANLSSSFKLNMGW